jgi:hypothetical protein
MGKCCRGNGSNCNKKGFSNLPISLVDNESQEKKISNEKNFVELYRNNLKRVILNTTKIKIKKNKMRYNIHSIDTPYNIGNYTDNIKKSLRKSSSNCKYSIKINPPKPIQKSIHQTSQTSSYTPFTPRPLNE